MIDKLAKSQKSKLFTNSSWLYFEASYKIRLKMMEFFLCVFGMVMIIEGLPYFAFPKRMKFWIQKISITPDGALRKFGLVLMSIGLLLVYFGRR